MNPAYKRDERLIDLRIHELEVLMRARKIREEIERLKSQRDLPALIRRQAG